MNHASRFFIFLLIIFLLFATSAWLIVPRLVSASGPSATTYLVSSSSGSDSNDGISAPFKTLAKVNSLTLAPGDQVLLKCGDSWQGEQLIISQSGTEDSPITFGSYPADCADKPVISGSLPVSGWTPHSGNIFVADLSTGANSGLFPHGLNQLFRDGDRLMMGRWPNLPSAENGGYSTVDAQPSGTQLSDNELPPGDWTGGIIRIKTIRWLLVNRAITASSGTTLTLNDDLSCWGDTCAGWGYFIQNHLNTLDQDGEWYYDADSNRVYLYSSSGTPNGIEGSAVMDPDDGSVHGGLMLSDSAATAHVIVDNLAIQNWFNRGISAAGSMSGDIYHHITVQNTLVKDVDSAGVQLRTWIWEADNGTDSMRGGHHMLFRNNVIDGANHFGITGYFAESLFEHNSIRNIGLIENLNISGMGCGLTGDSCTENGDGFRIRIHDPSVSGHSNTVRANRIERTGYNGIDVFGPTTTLEQNVIVESCYSKGDCGGVRTFGRDNLSATNVHDIVIRDNIIRDIIGNTDGCNETFSPLFGMGLYIDHYSRDVVVENNTIANTTFTGLLFQNSTGSAESNTIYNAASGSMYAAQISLAGSPTRASLTNNTVVALADTAWTLYTPALSNLTASDYNAFFHPYDPDHISHASYTRYSFPEWQALSQLDTHSNTNWFSQSWGEPPRTELFVNDSAEIQTIDLGTTRYLDTDQNEVVGTLTLPPYSSQVLVEDGVTAITLRSLSPAIWRVGDSAEITLTVQGAGFTANSVVRWNGDPRPTEFVNSGTLRATIPPTDLDEVGTFSVTVYDASQDPAESNALPFSVVDQLEMLFLPLLSR